MPSRRLILTLTVMVFFVIQMGTPQFSRTYNHDTNSSDSNLMSPVNSKINKDQIEENNQFQASDEPISGVLNPALVEQYGNSTTGVLDSRTDSGVNTASSIPIDNSTGWMGSQTQIKLWNMERLYAQNGTFDEGVGGTNIYPDPVTAYPNGWKGNNLDWYDPSGGTQTLLASYDNDSGYVSVETHGEERTTPSILYWHYDGTYVYWNQTVNNVPYSNNLTLTFRYDYDSGILDKYLVLNGYILLTYFIDDNIYIIKDLMDMSGTPARDTWYDVTVANITDAPSSFQFGVGIYIYTTDSKGYFVANPGGDYDGDGGIDGDYTRVIRVLLDDIKLVGSIPPSYDEVDLKFHAGEYETPVVQIADYGTAIITNPSYWMDSSIALEISSNVSISCSYEVKLLAHNFRNTTRTSQPTQIGVAYSISPGESSFLSMFTYIGSEGVNIYENFTVQLYIPIDWENVTVYDPFLNDVTGQCTFLAGLLAIPTSILNRLGWWQITCNSPNYAKSIISQVRHGGSWSDSTLFRPGNFTRTRIELGTAIASPGIGSPISIDWVMPNGTIWTSDSISDIIAGHGNSSVWTFGSTNTSAGVWKIQISWHNGTELAYRYATFDLYHSASATVKYPTIETDSGLVLSNQIILIDADSGQYLMDDSVSITANWSYTTVEFSQNFAKNWWQAEFDTSLIENGIFNVVVDISRPYFDPITAKFTVISIFETNLEITNAGSLPIDSGLNEVFTAQLTYELLNGTGVEGAIPTITHTGTVNGLSSTNFVDYHNGQYSIDIVCNTSDTYEVTIKLSKPFYYNMTDSFTLIIGETNTDLEIMNGTADVVQYGHDYRLVVEYRNSTGQGLSSANLQIISINPISGITYSGFTPLYDGFYEITLTPVESGTYSIVVGASLLNHETQYVTFTLTVSGIPTILTSLPSSKTVAINQTFILQLRFQDEEFHTINSSTIILVNPPAGLIYSAVIPIGNGLYNITLQSTEIKTYNLLFRANTTNYQSASAGFTFDVTQIQTILHFEDDVASTTVEFEKPYELIIYYDRLDSGAPIQDANITILPADVTDLGFIITEYSGYYIVTIRGHQIGTWTLTVIANKTDHRVASKQFSFTVKTIGTTVQVSSSLETFYIGRSYQFTFDYIFESNRSTIRGAVVVPFGAGADWVTYVEGDSGQYLVNLTPLELGESSVLLTFERLGFESFLYRINFNVSRIPITIEVKQGLNAHEYSQSQIILRITEADSHLPISGIDVFCYIIDPNGAAGSSIAMDETSNSGEYSAYITMPVAEGIYQLQVTCEATNYVFDGVYTVNLQPQRDFMSMIFVTTTRYYPVFIALAAVGVGLVYRRAARKRRILENKETLAVKRRFDDVRSLLGVIVLHKDSGLPVYSKILREGLEEAVISAFISAITSFRGEFDIESSSEEWGLIPISDIIRVISTNKLLCAFITTGNPSPEQREKMIQFAKTVGFIFDETMDDVPIVVLDHHTTAQFDALFEDILDGQLLRTYKLDESRKFPTSTCANERIARKHGEEFKLEELASEIAGCGLEETRVYKAIMVALENHYLVKTEDSPFSTELLRAPDIADEEAE